MAKLTYTKKDLHLCPICANKFKEEVMFTGGARQVSDKLTKELRTIYKNYNKKEVVPFIYEVLSCPKCLYSALTSDFDIIFPTGSMVTEKKKKEILQVKTDYLKSINTRKEIFDKLNTDIDYTIPKTLIRSLAEYMIAVKTYDYFSEHEQPIIKKAISSIRTAWLADDLGFDEIKDEYYHKAFVYYKRFTSAPDNTDGIKLGPDWGNNFGFDGARYLTSVLELRYIDELPTLNEKFEALKTIRLTLSKLRGYGKASKQKVGPLLRLTEEMFENISPVYDKLKNIVETEPEKSASSDSNVSINLINKIEDKDKNKDKDTKKTEVVQDKVNEVAKKDIASNDKESNISEEAVLNELYNKTANDIVNFIKKNGLKKDTVDKIVKIIQYYF